MTKKYPQLLLSALLLLSSFSAPLTASANEDTLLGPGVNFFKITLNRATPTGYVPLNASGVEFARFDLKSYGGSVLVKNLPVLVDTSVAGAGLNNAKLYVNGVQIGPTQDLVEDTSVVFNLRNSLVVPANSTKTLVIRGDVLKAAGTSFTAGDTITVKLAAGSNNAVWQSTGRSFSTNQTSGRTLTVQTGAITTARNSAMGDATSANPTGVVGATNVRLGSFVITAGLGEGSSVSQITVTDGGSSPVPCSGVITITDSPYLGCFAQNLKLMHGATQIGSTMPTLNSSSPNNVTFSPSPAITLTAGEQYILDVYADILNSTMGNVLNRQFTGVNLGQVRATGAITGMDTSSNATRLGQLIYLVGSGSLTVSTDASSPAANQIVMGTSDVTMGNFKLTAGPEEDIDVTQVVVQDTSAYGGSVSNLKLYSGSTQIGSTVAALSAASNGIATFDLITAPLRVTKGSNLLLTVKATANAYANAVSGSYHTFGLTDGLTARGVQSGASIGETGTPTTANQQALYRTKALFASSASTPNGSSAESSSQDIFEFNVSAAANVENLDATLNTVAVSLSGSSLLTGTGSASLYRSTDLFTPLATEAYRSVVADAAGTSTTLVDAVSPNVSGIPIGSTVRIYDSSASAYFPGSYAVTAIAANGTVSYSPATPATTASGDLLYYRPLQPGSGKLYFGAMADLIANAANGATSVSVSRTVGFSVGDQITLHGFSSAGLSISSTAGGVITGITSANTLTVTPLTLPATIDYDYSSGTVRDSSYPVQNAVVYTGLLNGGVGLPIAAGSTITLVVKGDTTGANTTIGSDTLHPELTASSDVNWDDQLMFGIASLNQAFPVLGGTLVY